MKEIIFLFYFIEGEIKFQILHVGSTKERWVDNGTKPMRNFKVVKGREMSIRLDGLKIKIFTISYYYFSIY